MSLTEIDVDCDSGYSKRHEDALDYNIDTATHACTHRH